MHYLVWETPPSPSPYLQDNLGKAEKRFGHRVWCRNEYPCGKVEPSDVTSVEPLLGSAKDEVVVVDGKKPFAHNTNSVSHSAETPPERKEVPLAERSSPKADLPPAVIGAHTSYTIRLTNTTSGTTLGTWSLT